MKLSSRDQESRIQDVLRGNPGLSRVDAEKAVRAVFGAGVYVREPVPAPDETREFEGLVDLFQRAGESRSSAVRSARETLAIRRSGGAR